MPLADAHAHLEMLEDPAGALARAALAGVEVVVAICEPGSAVATLRKLPQWLEGAKGLLGDRGRPDLRPPLVPLTLGLHPHDARRFDASVEADLGRLLASGRFAAIGETGLDFHYDRSPREAQRRAFKVQLALAHRLRLPVVVHMREAADEVLAILKELGVPEAGCVIHCFTEGPEVAERFLEAGCYLSFAGPVTFPKAEDIRQSAHITPLDRVMVETDCPYLAPVPHRGRPNEPAFTAYILECLAQAKGMATSQVAEAALENVCRVFGCAPVVDTPVDPLVT